MIDWNISISYPIPYNLVTTAKSFQRIPQEDLVVPQKLTGVGSRVLLESRPGDCHGKMPGLVQLSATSHMQACMQWGMATIFGPNLRNNSDKDLSDCNSFQLFLLGDFLFPLGPADPGQRASERSWTRTTRQLCRVQRPPTLFSATSPLSHLSKAPNPEKRPHLLCRLFFSSPKWPTCGGKVCQKVEYVGRKLPHCPGLCTFWLAGLPGAAHQPPFTLSDSENPRKKSELGERVWKPVGAECCVGSLLQWRGLPPEAWPGNLTRGQSLCFRLLSKKEGGGVFKDVRWIAKYSCL